MNRLILESWELEGSRLLLNGERARHLLEICRVKEGDTVKLGIVNGSTGTGTVLAVYPEKIDLAVQLADDLPSVPKPTIYLALPRPQMLRRILQKSATFGIKRLVLFKSERVEKSYFSSPLLHESSIASQLRVGMEQGGSTYMPEVVVYKRFRDFFERESHSGARFILDPEGAGTLINYSKSIEAAESLLFVIGPEGGFLPREKDLFCARGYESLVIAENILRVESAFDFIIAQYSMIALAGLALAGAGSEGFTR